MLYELNVYSAGAESLQGRPWASLVAAQNGLPGFIEANYSFMNFQIDAPDFDPVVENITREPGCPVGGTGVMFSNRRRNKWAGRVVGSTRTDSHLNFTVEVNESLGYMNSSQEIL
jgi:hypothetical protein